MPLFFGCFQPQARAPVTRYRLVFVLGHLGHHRLVLDFLILDSGVIGLALLALGCIATDTQSLRRLEAHSSTALPHMLTIVSSCSADLGLTQPPATTYASCMTHAVLSSMYLNTPALAPVPQFNLLVTGTGELPSAGSCSLYANLVTGTDHSQVA
jgi:hypothetical protein